MEPQIINLVLLPFYGLAVLFGILGNLLFIVVVKRTRFMHTTTNFLLANIAAADVISLAFCVPGVILQFIDHPKGGLGSFLCKFVSMHHVAGITLLVSGITLTVISFERHNALLLPMEENLRLQKQHVYIAISLIWAFSIAFVIPLFVAQKYVDEVKNCHMDWKASTSKAYWSLLAALVILSFLVMVFCYFRIVKAVLNEDILSSDNQGNKAEEEDNKSKRKLVRLLITVTLIFLVCFVPFAAVSAMNVATDTLPYKVSYFLAYCSCSFNPIVYVIQSSNYRTALKNVCSNRRRVHAIEEHVAMT